MDNGLLLTWGRETGFLELSSEAVNFAVEADIALENFISIERKFNYLIENLRDYAFSLLNIGNNRDHDIEVLSRHLMNVLSISKSYIDGIPQHINKIFGKNSIEAKSTPDFFRKEYDSRIGYRVMSALRNHVQHHGIPAHSMTFEDMRDLVDQAQAVKLYINIRKLREDSSFKAAILNELAIIGDDVPVKPLLLDFVKGLLGVHRLIENFLGEKLLTFDDFSHPIMEKMKASFESKGYPETISLVRRGDEFNLSIEWRYFDLRGIFARIKSNNELHEGSEFWRVLDLIHL